ncbi:hypothetical protein ACMYSQ_008404 [Aspergillus niger]
MHSAVTLLMEVRKISATETCRVLEQLIIDYEQEALRLRDEPLAGHGQSDTSGFTRAQFVKLNSSSISLARTKISELKES